MKTIPSYQLHYLKETGERLELLGMNVVWDKTGGFRVEPVPVEVKTKRKPNHKRRKDGDKK